MEFGDFRGEKWTKMSSLGVLEGKNGDKNGDLGVLGGKMCSFGVLKEKNGAKMSDFGILEEKKCPILVFWTQKCQILVFWREKNGTKM